MTVTHVDHACPMQGHCSEEPASSKTLLQRFCGIEGNRRWMCKRWRQKWARGPRGLHGRVWLAASVWIERRSSAGEGLVCLGRDKMYDEFSNVRRRPEGVIVV